MPGLGQQSKPSHIPLPRPEQFEAFKAQVLQMIQVKIVHSDRVALFELLRTLEQAVIVGFVGL